ncbi:MAG: GNAT family N-acetyltransferase [Streptosporangiaceae bacterium]
MDSDLWPLAALRLQTPLIELRPPSDRDLADLARVAAAGIHDPQVQPFTVAWTDVSPAERARSVLQHHWRQLAAWTPEHWQLQLVVVHDGAVVGTQGISGHNFAVLREVATGSWLGQAYQHQGIGTEMRAAVLQLAFAGLGAEYAISGAFTDNAASLTVSRNLGYLQDGIDQYVSRGRAATLRRLRLDRQAWQATQRTPVSIGGLEACLPMFGLTPDGAPSA